MMSRERIMGLAWLGMAEARAAERYREAERGQRVLAAVRTLIEARADDLAKMGYALVPLEPTEAMIEAAVRSFVRENHGIEHAPAVTWRAMVAAAAEPEDAG